jgi:hypothetical protein
MKIFFSQQAFSHASCVLQHLPSHRRNPLKTNHGSLLFPRSPARRLSARSFAPKKMVSLIISIQWFFAVAIKVR